MKDVLRFLGLAAALGVAAGMVLASIAVVLATPAYGMEGGLVLRAEGRESIAAPLVATDVTFRVSGPLARARVVQTFHNPEAGWFEAVYLFPMPEGAAVDRLRLQIGERVIEGEIRERGAARMAYGAARAAGQRAALLGQERPNVFTTEVGNIGPGETVVVEIEYQQLLRYDGGRFSLRFPMVVAPRYVPARPLLIADTGRITAPVLRPGDEEGRTNPASIPVALAEYDKVVGELPRGSTGSRFALASGLAVLLFSCGLLLLQRRRT